ncbi:MAG TPA: ROK family protein, partial [Terriglobales bacterium]|nr:ROK family protein [Terriglobales bacterium]
ETYACGVAVDMGASHLRFVMATTGGEIRSESREYVKAEAGPAGVIAQVRAGIERLLEGSNAKQGSLQGIAIGVPGGVDPQTGKVIDANNVPGWREVDMGRELEEAFGAPVFLDNDANMAAIGEHWRGVAQGVDNFVFIALGTGIGSGVFVDGRIRRGRSGFAGELYRMNLDGTRWNDDFPDTGYLEAQVSGVALAAEGRKILTKGNGAASATLTEIRDARYVFDALRQGNRQALTLVERSFSILGVAVANVVSVLDPELIVFNGGIVKGAPELLLETVERVVRRIHPKPPRVQLSTLEDKAQIWGALHTLLHPEQHGAIRAGSVRWTTTNKKRGTIVPR